jgi:hypothetical protein
VHICRNWRRIVLAFQQTLHFQLFCTHGTPVRKSLDCWSAALPIVVEYGRYLTADPPTPEDKDNIIIIALNQSDRVTSISLAVTMMQLSDIKGPFLGLEDLVLLSLDTERPTLSNAFRWGILRSFHLTRIALFAFPRFLYYYRNLVDLQLHDVFDPRLCSPEALTDALSGMAQLRSLSLHLLPTTDHVGVSPPSQTRVFLPALTHLNFQGISQYLENFVGGVDAPHLGTIEIIFKLSNRSIRVTDFSYLRTFTDRIEMHKSHSQVHIWSSEHAISISCTQPGARTCINLQVFCKRLSDQLSFMSRILIQLPAFHSDVEDLHISETRKARGEDSRLWLEPFNSFTSVKWIHVTANLSTDIVYVLRSGKSIKSLLPALQKLYIVQPHWQPRHEPLGIMVVLFMTSRWLSGHHVAVEYVRLVSQGELHGRGTIYTRTSTNTC